MRERWPNFSICRHLRWIGLEAIQPINLQSYSDNFQVSWLAVSCRGFHSHFAQFDQISCAKVYSCLDIRRINQFYNSVLCYWDVPAANLARYAAIHRKISLYSNFKNEKHRKLVAHSRLSPKVSSNMSKQFTVEEVSQHKTEKEGQYIIVDSSVYDITSKILFVVLQ